MDQLYSVVKITIRIPKTYYLKLTNIFTNHIYLNLNKYKKNFKVRSWTNRGQAYFFS